MNKKGVKFGRAVCVRCLKAWATKAGGAVRSHRCGVGYWDGHRYSEIKLAERDAIPSACALPESYAVKMGMSGPQLGAEADGRTNPSAHARQTTGPKETQEK